MTIRDGQKMLDALCDRLWPVQAAPEPRACVAVSDSDAVIIKRASQAKNGTLFRALWAGDWRSRYGSQSEADLALCALLAFWAGGDAARVDALFRSSGLMRAKWDRDDYRRWTLERATTGGRA